MLFQLIFRPKISYFYTWNWIPFAEPIPRENKVILQAWKAIELKPFYARKSISFTREKLIGILLGLQVLISGRLSGPITIFVRQRLQGASRKSVG